MADQQLFLDGVSIALNGRVLLAVSHRVEVGEVLTVMGPSGSGKSTLLAYIGGFLDPAFSASGKVFSGNEEITALPAEERHAGILFQDPLLFPHMSVGGNLLFAIPPSIKGKAARSALVKEALGGVGLARVLLSAPRMLLLDEPFSKLDAELRSQMRELVFAKARTSHLPVVLVTHDEADAEAAGG